jgi:general secretion pathway protein K
MKREQGVALISVLLIVAIASLITTTLLARQHLAIRSTSNQLGARQALYFALGGEALAQSVLRRDLQRAGTDPQNPIDHLGEDWAQVLPPLPIEHGQIAVRIDDLAGRFNINSLVQDQQVNHVALARFQRLLRLLEIKQVNANALIDWLDDDQQVNGAGGAEDPQYLLAEPAYRNAGQALAAISELRLLQGMSEADYQRLRPYVSALPARTPLNVNTASAHVLASLADGLSLASAEKLRAQAARESYRDLGAFLGHPALAGVAVTASGLAVGSQFFAVRSEVSLAGRHLVLLSTVQRSASGQVLVLGRNFAPAALLNQSATGTQQDNP